MLAVNYSTIRNKLKEYCDKVTDLYETIIVTRKDEKNVVILSLEKYNQLEKAARNNDYLYWQTQDKKTLKRIKLPNRFSQRI